MQGQQNITLISNRIGEGLSFLKGNPADAEFVKGDKTYPTVFHWFCDETETIYPFLSSYFVLLKNQILADPNSSGTSSAVDISILIKLQKKLKSIENQDSVDFTLENEAQLTILRSHQKYQNFIQALLKKDKDINILHYLDSQKEMKMLEFILFTLMGEAERKQALAISSIYKHKDNDYPAAVFHKIALDENSKTLLNKVLEFLKPEEVTAYLEHSSAEGVSFIEMIITHSDSLGLERANNLLNKVGEDTKIRLLDNYAKKNGVTNQAFLSYLFFLFSDKPHQFKKLIHLFDKASLNKLFQYRNEKDQNIFHLLFQLSDRERFPEMVRLLFDLFEADPELKKQLTQQLTEQDKDHKSPIKYMFDSDYESATVGALKTASSNDEEALVFFKTIRETMAKQRVPEMNSESAIFSLEPANADLINLEETQISAVHAPSSNQSLVQPPVTGIPPIFDARMFTPFALPASSIDPVFQTGPGYPGGMFAFSEPFNPALPAGPFYPISVVPQAFHPAGMVPPPAIYRSPFNPALQAGPEYDPSSYPMPSNVNAAQAPHRVSEYSDIQQLITFNSMAEDPSSNNQKSKQRNSEEDSSALLFDSSIRKSAKLDLPPGSWSYEL